MVGLFFAWAEDGEMIDLYLSDGTGAMPVPYKIKQMLYSRKGDCYRAFLSKNKRIAMLFYGFFSFIKIVII